MQYSFFYIYPELKVSSCGNFLELYYKFSYLGEKTNF